MQNADSLRRLYLDKHEAHKTSGKRSFLKPVNTQVSKQNRATITVSNDKTTYTVP